MQAFFAQLLTIAGFPECVKRAYANDNFVQALEEQKSLDKLNVLKEGRWVYYEGTAGRNGSVWGWCVFLGEEG